MKRRVFTILLSAIILWASLAAYAHKTYASDIRQFRPSSETVAVAISMKFREAEQETTDHLLAPIGSFSITKPHTLYQTILYTSPSIHKSARAYIIYRVFRT